MSKLAEKIRKVTRIQSQPLGFGSARTAAEPTLVLAGRCDDSASAAELVRKGADAVIVGSAKSPAASGAAAGIKDAIAGAWVPGKAAGEAKAYTDAGFDFIVFDPDRTSATAVLDDNAGYVMAVPAGLGDAETRALESFQLDAIDIGAIQGPLTVRGQMDLRRLFSMTRKPLMAGVPGDIDVAELEALRDANVVVVVAEGAAAVERLRKTIDSLPPRRRRKDGEDRPTPLVPHTTGVDAEEEEEET
ncbi:MAG: hypothetical protein EPO22_03550 [Dehalococcoidia bacterium]|nr:MAG: hypothetical protein EPO22_03550 [Dehalococcoidia bacterium]